MYYSLEQKCGSIRLMTTYRLLRRRTRLNHDAGSPTRTLVCPTVKCQNYRLKVEDSTLSNTTPISSQILVFSCVWFFISRAVAASSIRSKNLEIDASNLQRSTCFPCSRSSRMSIDQRTFLPHIHTRPIFRYFKLGFPHLP